MKRFDQQAAALWLVALMVVVAIRFHSLSTYPLTDNTEARYGEVARVMVTSGNWLTPQLEIGVPFWAKPPLSFWQNAASMSLLGVSELSARLPALLNMLLVLSLLYCLARKNSNSQVAMVGFWWLFETRDRRFGYVFIAALSLGMLAKGPVAWILVAVPLVVWLTIERRWSALPRLLPIAPGAALLCAATLPWFLLAEIETPGYLSYFFIGEHLHRYLDSGWAGDLYGSAHDEPRGTIWLFALAAFAPWSAIAVALILATLPGNLQQLLSGHRSQSKDALSRLQRYLWLWLLWPMVFFSFAGNILATYVLPGLPAFALLLAIELNKTHFRQMLTLVALVVPFVVYMANPLGLIDKLKTRSQSTLIEQVQQRHPQAQIVYVGDAPHSARFYSQGKAQFPRGSSELNRLLTPLNCAVLVVRDGHLPTKFASQLHKITVWSKYTAYLYVRGQFPERPSAQQCGTSVLPRH
jgi:4-amino-4-deoxy-L-arabinose transferase-like glycosyltransferase